MRRVLIAVVLTGVFTLLFAGPAAAADQTWNDVVDEMEVVLDESYARYAAGDAGAAKDQVDVAYFGYYEKLGFEKTVMSSISGDRAATVEYQFSLTKKQMLGAAPDTEVRESLNTLVTMLREDADTLDGTQESGIGALLASLLIILREGFEAILVVGAIVAYLVKSGNKDKVAAVYWGSLTALGASVVLAVLLTRLTQLSGANQEIIEGATMLVAAALLVYVGNWILSKADVRAWSSYIDSKTEKSLTTGSVLSLAFVAFLAVFREGAETILFYQALLAQTDGQAGMIWLGLGIGAALLVVVYLLIRLLSIKLPQRPFFIGTGVLLSVMALSFVGTGIKELQEGNVVSVTPVPGVGSIDLLGIYPTWETLVPQIVTLVLLVVLFVVQFSRPRRRAQADQLPSGGSTADLDT
jgi:high-affinity iron transporter